MNRPFFAFLALVTLPLVACKDLARFDTINDHYEGTVLESRFVRNGTDVGTKACLTLDTLRLQDGPGTISTSDGRFRKVALRPIPQVWHDKLSTMSLGEDDERSIIYATAPFVPAVDGGFSAQRDADTLTVVSLLKNGDVELRIMRGAPLDLNTSRTTPETSLFAIYYLTRAPGPCSF